MRRRFLLFAWAFAGSPFVARAQEVTAMAASSLTDSMWEPGAIHSHAAPRFAFAASSVLAWQVEHVVPTGIVASANEPRALLAFLTRPEAPPARCKLGCSIRR